MQARIVMILRHELSNVTCHVDSVAQTGVCFDGILELDSAWSSHSGLMAVL
jgi:hypothetical protein